MLNWAMRYGPVIEAVDGYGARNLLDVGSGWFGITWYRPGRAVQTDLRFEGAPPAGPRVGTAAFVAADAAALPFRDDAFDVVVCVDLVEHLPGAARDRAIRELTRVADRAVVVAFPVGESARRVDRLLHRAALVLPGDGPPPWLTEHLAQEEYPDRTTVENALPPGWAISSESGIGNLTAQTAVVLAEMLPGLRRLTARAGENVRQGRLPRWLDRGATYRRMFVLERTGY